MSLVLQVVITGLAAGAGYGLIGTAIALVHRLTGVIHFAIGEIVSLAVFATLFVAGAAGSSPDATPGAARLVAATVAGLVVAAVVGAAVYPLGVRPFRRGAGAVGWVGGMVAVALLLRGVLLAAFPRTSYVLPDPLWLDHLRPVPLGGGAAIPGRAFALLAVALGLSAVTAWVAARTRFGKALRAIESDPEGAALVGIPVERMRTLAFGFVGALCMVPALVLAPTAPVSVNTGAVLGLKGLAAALLARMAPGSRVLQAGLALGVLESAVASLHLGPLRLGPEYRDIVPLLVVVAVMAVRRQGSEGAAA